MSTRRWRPVGAAIILVAALALAVLLVSVQYGLAEEYGAGPGTTLLPFALLPIGVAALAAAMVGFRRTVVAALATFVVLTLAATALAAPLGGQARDRRAQSNDAAFTCNGPNAQIQVPGEVDAAFHQVAHPAPYWLYGPLSGSPLGCTAGIEGPTEESFPAWRSSLLDSGWDVEQDGPEVVVVRGGVRLTLYRDGELSMLHASVAEADDCEDGRSTDLGDGQVSIC
ncbi:hypothetical protein [Nocardioides piscis]|uniref:Uncharacterized protein n=1 Tax=Nocardioides piscis TaxID=2714938 RepID=A0A6G7YHR6_9ACTN|nr:hypothetical protein [Nocardioides piscis]QIK76343.1 hypothetical protein G7071_13875 [Nocardioides piscis]